MSVSLSGSSSEEPGETCDQKAVNVVAREITSVCAWQ